MERAVARIDFGAIRANCERLKAALDGAELCAVVKADGYGHGALGCAEAALSGGATRLAVATATEAEQIGRRLQHVSLLTMGPLTAEEVDAAISAGSELSVWREDFRRLVADRARAHGHPARLHVKYDSGMGRLGNRDAIETIELARACAADPDLELTGIWTHFATADELDSTFFDEQLERFDEVAKAVKAEHPAAVVHAANSAAVLRDKRSHYEMARCGVAIYGLDPFQHDPADQGLRPALSLRSYLADVKRFSAGASAGYGRKWKAPVDTWVGVIPLGYGDGVRRALTNNADVLVGGRRYPLVGTVSMDNLTIELGPETDVEPGDEAVLIGRQGDEEILAEEVARRLETINYEVACAISPRVPRRPA
ncbi:MAG: alanine racemase [Solirubrobacterales bacterium]|jgi:alanine racemase|nr:alanine racemase [Solirubrobacterales bacterium]